MTPKRKIIFVIAMTGIFLILVGGWLTYRKLIAPALATWRSMPEDISVSRVTVNKLNLSKKIFLETEYPDETTDLSINENGSSKSSDLVVVSKVGAMFVDPDGKMKERISFRADDGESNNSHRRNSRVAHSFIKSVIFKRQLYGYVTDTTLIDGTIFINKDGTVAWRFAEGKSVQNAKAVEQSNSDAPEYVVSYGAENGIDLVDSNGRKIKRIADDRAYSLQTIRLKSANEPVIAYLDSGTEHLFVRNLTGEKLRDFKLPFPFAIFVTCRYPSKDGEYRGLVLKDEKLWIFDFDGNVIATPDAPLSDKLSDVRATTVKVKENEAEYLAVTATFDIRRTVFFLYDSNGNLVYQEILDDGNGGLLALPSVISDREDLFIATSSKIWRYSLPDQ